MRKSVLSPNPSVREDPRPSTDPRKTREEKGNTPRDPEGKERTKPIPAEFPRHTPEKKDEPQPVSTGTEEYVMRYSDEPW